MFKIPFPKSWGRGLQRVKSYECVILIEWITERICNTITVTVIIQPLICADIKEVNFFAALPIEYVNYEVEFEI